MKRHHIYTMITLLGSILLLPSLFSCSSDPIIIDEPVIDRGVVKAKIALFVSSSSAGMTRQTSTTVQGTSSSFRGMTNMTLATFHKNAVSEVVAEDQLLTSKSFVIPHVNTFESGAMPIFYGYVKVPVGTNAVLFYGEAKPDVTTYYDFLNKAIPNEFVNGCTDVASTNEATAGEIQFSPRRICTASSADAKMTNICAYLTNIANAGEWASQSETSTMGKLRTAFISMHAGSSASIQAAVQELYNSIKNRSGDLADAIKAAITNVTYASVSTNGTLTFTDAVSGFPANISLPDGAVSINFNSSEFVPTPVTSNIDGYSTASLNSYVYPASLYYRCNSPIKASDNDEFEHYSQIDHDTWLKILNEYSYDNASVTSKTQSIAMKNTVQYAVAHLDATIRANENTLRDNAEETFNVSASNSGILFTGILIGGQQKVNFEFTNPEGLEYIIYDRHVLNNQYLASMTPITNHTLALETAICDGSEGKVKVAVEFYNRTDRIITGHNGCLIYPNTHFYLVGELDASSNTSTMDASGNPIKRVLLQDYTTKVNFVVQNLKNAYNVVPDLRLSKLELGISVDLKWTKGISQEIVIN